MLLLLQRVFRRLQHLRGWERWTDRSRQVLTMANEHALAENGQFILPRHILAALIDQQVSVGCHLLALMNINAASLRAAIAVPDAASRPFGKIRKLPLSPDAAAVIDCAWKSAVSLDENHAGTEHLLLGLIAVDCDCASHLRQAGANSPKARSLLLANRAQIHAHNQHFPRALADLQAALTEWPENGQALQMLERFQQSNPLPSGKITAISPTRKLQLLLIVGLASMVSPFLLKPSFEFYGWLLGTDNAIPCGYLESPLYFWDALKEFFSAVWSEEGAVFGILIVTFVYLGWVAALSTLSIFVTKFIQSTRTRSKRGAQ